MNGVVEIKKAMVLGMARSGVGAARLLLNRGAKVIISDLKSREEFNGALDVLDVPDVEWRLGEAPDAYIDETIDALVISPGIELKHPAVKLAKEKGIEVIGELELAFRESTGLMLAITGTNGKTTTCTLLGEIFKNVGRRTEVVGNIGNPYSVAAIDMQPGDVTICEVSSFQLETTKEFHPAVAAVLNISEDHLNRHGSMERYIALKERIYENCGYGDYLVLNYDDPITRSMAESAHCGVVWFSIKEDVPEGAFLRDGMVVYGTADNFRQICGIDEIYIPGEHNLKNALAATAMAMLCGVPAPVIRHTLRTFKGVEHRIEFTRELDGVKFYNDSKGTNVDSTIQAVRAMKNPTVLIAGGYDKHVGFDELSKEIINSMIKKVVLIGDTAKQIETSLLEAGFDKANIYHAAYDFDRAVKMSFENAQPGWNVLLSPSCASFDMFSDYEQRGRIFKKKVAELTGKN